ncbi:GIY-YIG nuclease family protein [Streptomyces sp. SP18ES09]|uniref:GIY-YIG nuclease family protein n=1 Tax=Streptomyces sp. SP18ES09 TaxID=3002532 RepID=UPI002E7984FF|nr:GIY-YIG nuclease family protein [Streptomyces sp. SP18ES09]MEE1813539.1 GIY-YIG nuclease family protein [Streptomyces sp. SP18ES09]
MDKVDPRDPDRTEILLMVHRFELAGIEIDERAVEIAAKYMRWERALRAEQSAKQQAEWEQRQAETEVRECWVYFIRIGQLVKIGMTTNLANRFSSLRPNEVLAIQPGGLADETALHRKFASLRAGGEFFHPGPPLQEHIRELRQRIGAPRWRKSLVPDGNNWFTDS